MTRPDPLAKLPRLPRPWAAIAFLLLLAANGLLFAGRKSTALRSDWLLRLDPDAYSHVSNFALSYLLLAGIGYAWLMLGVRGRWIAMLCVACAVINVVYETWIPVLNTPDPVDAAYGLAGCALAGVVLWLFDGLGMVANPAHAARRGFAPDV